MWSLEESSSSEERDEKSGTATCKEAEQHGDKIGIEMSGRLINTNCAGECMDNGTNKQNKLWTEALAKAVAAAADHVRRKLRGKGDQETAAFL